MPDLPMHDRRDVVLPEPDADATAALDAAARGDADERRAAFADVVADRPTFLQGWAALAGAGRDRIERYAFARVGYHRGLDAIRANGWGGDGYVRWEHPTNRGFLTCLVRLRDAADEIGESDEVDRIDGFLRDLDPAWDDANV